MIDVEPILLEIEQSDRTPETVQAILADQNMQTLRRMGNELMITGGQPSERASAWRNREASKQQLIAAITHAITGKATRDMDMAPEAEEEEGQPVDQEPAREGYEPETNEPDSDPESGDGEPESESDSGEQEAEGPAPADDPKEDSEEDPEEDSESQQEQSEVEGAGEPETETPEESEAEPEPETAPKAVKMPEDAKDTPEKEAEIAEEAPETAQEATDDAPAHEPLGNLRSQDTDALWAQIAGKVSPHLNALPGDLDESRVREIAAAVATDLDESLCEELQARMSEGTRATVESVISQKFKEAGRRMAQDILEALEAATPTIRVEVPGRAAVEIEGHVHRSLEPLCNMLAAGLHVMLVGPSGSGKTHGCESAAKAIGLKFYSMSVGAQTTMSQIMGYMDATGRYVRTVFRDAYEFGGLFLIDEIDAGNPNVLTALNATLANGTCAFPDGMITDHPDFRCVAAANTYGTGQDRQYVGRNQLDATSLDRFAALVWDYDQALELQIAGLDPWVAAVQTLRKAANELSVRHIISPRASIQGARLCLQGALPLESIMDAVVWRGLERSQRAKIVEKAATMGLPTMARLEKMITEERYARLSEPDQPAIRLEIVDDAEAFEEEEAGWQDDEAPEEFQDEVAAMAVGE